jgi:hypothetical protein
LVVILTKQNYFLTLDFLDQVLYNIFFCGKYYMAQGYSKEFLVDAFLSRYIHCRLITVEQLESLEQLAIKLYDRVGKDKFRDYCSLDANAIKLYKAQL